MSRKSNAPLTELYLTVAQAAAHFSVHPSTIRRWIDQGYLPAYRLGEKRIGVRPSDLAQLVTPRPPRQGQGQGGGVAHAKRSTISRLTKEEKRRGLQALAELERLSAAIAARQGTLTPEAWELLNQARGERTRDLRDAVEG